MIDILVIDLLLQYILSGSDDFNLYMWKIPDEPIEGLCKYLWHLIIVFHSYLFPRLQCII